MALTDADVSIIKGMLARGDRQSDVAAWFGCNSGAYRRDKYRESRCQRQRCPARATTAAGGPYTVQFAAR